MKTTGNFWSMLLFVSIGWVTMGCASGQVYNQPGYGQPYPGTNQPGYNQPDYNNNQYGYDQPGYNNQPGYGQQYGQPDFYTELNQYGQWVQTPQYGQVWIPNAGPGFQPYATNGHWVVTEYGNTWVSDYNWGWAPFHYGRWYQDPYRGWAWVPGTEWGPAWVSWRSGGGYYGWAPLGPGGNGYGTIPAPYWTFVPQIYITSPRVYSYYVPRPRVMNIYQQTTIINNVYQVNNRSYAYGPRRDEIERVTRQSVPVYRVENAGRPGRVVVQNNTVNIYRPNVNASQQSTQRRGTDSRGTDSRGTDSRGTDSRGTDSRGNGGYSDYSNRRSASPDNNTGQSGYGNRPRGTSVQENNPNPGTYNGGPRGGASRENAPATGTYSGQSRGNGADVIQATPQANRSYSGGRGRGGAYGQPESAQPVQSAPATPQPEQAPEQRSFPQTQRSRGTDSRGAGGESPVYQPRQNSRSVESGLPAPVREQGSLSQRTEQPAQPQPATTEATPSPERRSGSRGPR